MSGSRSLLRARQFFGPRDRSEEGCSEASTYARDWERAYRERWQHDRVVRSTHGVNCTGSCSWKIPGLGNGALFKLVPLYFPKSTGAATGIIGAAGGLGGFFPPLLLGIVKDATGEFVLAFVFLVAFAWMCAGMAVALLEPGRDPARSFGGPG